VFTYCEGSQASALCVYDAKTMAPEPVARVPIPGRVPYGFHGAFLTPAELRRHWEATGQARG